MPSQRGHVELSGLTIIETISKLCLNCFRALSYTLQSFGCSRLQESFCNCLILATSTFISLQSSLDQEQALAQSRAANPISAWAWIVCQHPKQQGLAANA